MRKINPQNYDLAFKEAFSIFEDKTLAFLGLDLPKIASFLETEFPEIETHDDTMDLNFQLDDGSILHLEEETHLSIDDLIRFAHYDLRLYQRYQKVIHTVVVTPASGTPGTKTLDTGTLHYRVHQVVLKRRDADAVLKKIRRALDVGEPVNELELIFLPLMESQLSNDTLLRETIQLERQLPDTAIGRKVILLTMVVANRIVDTEVLNEIWEEVRMLKIMQYAEEKGIEKGLKKGIVKGREEGREEGKLSVIRRQLYKKFGMLPDDINRQIDSLDETMLDLVGDAILDIHQLDDLRKVLHMT